MIDDLKIAIRQLTRSPVFAVVAIVTLALGIGANTAIFSVVDSVLLHPMPPAVAERMVQLAERNFRAGGFRENNGKPLFAGVSPPVLHGLLATQRHDSNILQTITWSDSAQYERKGADFAEIVFGEKVPAEFFATFAAVPMMGRTFAADEAVDLDENDVPKSDSVIVLSHAGWKRLTGGDPQVLGKTLELSGRRFTVIGVMPAHFRFSGGGTQFWIPVRPQQLPPGWMRAPNTAVFARLQPGVSMSQAQALLDTLARRVQGEHDAKRGYGQDWSRRPGGFGLWIRPAEEAITAGRENLQRTLFGLLGAIGFVLLIVCANVANLTLARAETRQQEMAVRAALGAGRLRLMRLLLTESLLLAVVGGTLGLIVAWWGIQLLTGLIPDYMPRMREIHVDRTTLGFTLLLSVVTGLVFGLAPAWRAGRSPLAESLKLAGAKATAAPSRARARQALIVAELALTLVLLTGAGLMIQSVARLLRVDPGFDPENLVRISIDLPENAYGDLHQARRGPALREALYARLHERLTSLPGVSAAGIGKHGAWPVKIKPAGKDEEVEVLPDGCGLGSADLFRAMRMPFRSGRTLDQTDAAGEGVVINETMARAVWPGEDAIGRRFGGSIRGRAQTFEVVGVVGDLRDNRFDQRVRPTFYRPCHEMELIGLRTFLVVRTQGDPSALVPVMRKELAALEPSMREPEIIVSRQVLYDSTQAQRTYMTYLVVFAGAGLALSALGIYGVLSYAVTKRRQEIGIRMALGAERRQVMGMILADGGRLALWGVAIGLVAAYWLGRFLQHQLFEVDPGEPTVLLGAVLLLVAVAFGACWIPARRATRVEPMEALRCE